MRACVRSRLSPLPIRHQVPQAEQLAPLISPPSSFRRQPREPSAEGPRQASLSPWLGGGLSGWITGRSMTDRRPAKTGCVCFEVFSVMNGCRVMIGHLIEHDGQILLPPGRRLPSKLSGCGGAAAAWRRCSRSGFLTFTCVDETLYLKAQFNALIKH